MRYSPARKIPKNYRNITGVFSSEKSSRVIAYESKLERDFLYLFELDNSIINMFEQPITLKSIPGIPFKYTPDMYLVTPDNKNDIIVEIKYYDELRALLKKDREKFRVINKHFKQQGIDFKFFTERCIYIQNENYKFNTHFLVEYNELPIDDFNFISEAYREGITINELLHILSSDKYKRLYILNSVWCMIRRNIFRVNLFEKLTLETKLLELRNYDEAKYKTHLEGKIPKGYLL